MAPRGRPRRSAIVLTTAQIRHVLRTARSRERFSDRAVLTLTLSLGLGLTAAELAGLRCGDVFDGGGAVQPSIHVRERTGTRSREVPISGLVRQALGSYGEQQLPWRSSSQEAPVFPSQKRCPLSPSSMARFLTALYRESGIAFATSKSGQWTVIARLAEDGVDVATIADFVGHSSGRLTLRTEPNPSRLRSALRNLLP